MTKGHTLFSISSVTQGSSLNLFARSHRIIKKGINWIQRNSRAGKGLALHAAKQGLIPSIRHGPPSLPGVLPDHRQVWPQAK